MVWGAQECEAGLYGIAMVVFVDNATREAREFVRG